MTGAVPSGPLAGLRVLDVSTMMAGPYAATLMGDLGADVIKVESHYGDESRHLGPARDGERSAYLSLNRSKRSLLLDLRLGEAQEVFARLLKTSDVVVTNVREPALSKLCVDYDSVRRHRPDIIWVGVTAFGASGPYEGRPGIDFLAQGYGGLLALNGEPDGEPVRVTVPLIDTLTSVLATTAALSALRVRDQTGEGQRVDLCLLDALVHAQAAGLGSYLITGEQVPRTGNRSLYFAPSGIYPTRDGKLAVITCPGEKFFGNLCRALEVEWASDPRFATIDDRMRNQDELDRVIGERTRDFTREELVERLVAADVLTAPIKESPEVAADPQVRHNGMIQTVQHPALGPIEVTGLPLHFSKTPGAVRRHPPILGEHTDEILRELGYAPHEIDALVVNRVAGRVERREAK
jgi:crotonobetainyl-CoA:carnitine CoA-transferase CaiB-like acyl-CoA transferase